MTEVATLPRQHAGRRRASYIDPRVFDRYRDGEAIDYQPAGAAGEARNGDATAIQGPLEKAVLKLLDD